MLTFGKITKSSVQDLSTKEIVEMYNRMVVELGQTPVKKFRDRKTAETRLLKLQDEWNDAKDHGKLKKIQDAVNEVETKVKKPTKRSTKKKVSKPKTKKSGSIKSLTIELIINGTEDKEIVAEVKKQFPDSKFDFSHVSWYRSTLFRDGIIGPEHAPRRSKAYKNWKQKANK